MIWTNGKEVKTAGRKYQDKKEPSKFEMFIRKTFIVLGVIAMILGFLGMFLEYQGEDMKFFYSYYGSLLLMIICGFITICICINPRSAKLYILMVISLIGYGLKYVCLKLFKISVVVFRRLVANFCYLKWAIKNKVKISESKLLYLRYLEERLAVVDSKEV